MAQTPTPSRLHIDFVTESFIKDDILNELLQALENHFNSKIQAVKPYPKFENSLRIALEVLIPEKTDPIRQSILLLESVCQPWLVWYHSDEDRLEMIFNKDRLSVFGQDLFEKIKWGQVQTG